MLRLSKKTDYALMATRHLAAQPGRGANAREIAGRHGIPLELLAKVLQRMVRQGLLISHQGINGGYQLARPPEAISVADVIQAIEGRLAFTACSEQDHRCEQYSTCSIRDPLWRIKSQILRALTSCTLADLSNDAPETTVSAMRLVTPASEAATAG